MVGMTLTLWFIAIILAYIIGSIPFGVILASMKGVNIREEGSKNIGATNVWRVLGKQYGITCFVLDVSKGAVPVYLAGNFAGIAGKTLGSYPETELWLWLGVALAPCFGHMYSFFLKFQGGKGVATTLGCMLGLYPLLTLPVLAVFLCWIFALYVSKIVSGASVIAAILLPFATYFHLESAGLLQSWPVVSLSTLIALFVVWKHRSNISRIAKGAEPRINPRR